MLIISREIRLSEKEVTFSAVRAQGPGGQHVNKSSTAIQIKFDIQHSTLPEFCKEQLLMYKDDRISRDGVIVIKAQRFRSQDKNRQDALERLVHLIKRAIKPSKKRKPTKPSKAAKEKRKKDKKYQSMVKKRRQKSCGFEE